MSLVPEGKRYDFSKDLFPRLLEMGWPMYAQAINGVWFDVGSPSELIRAQNVLIERKDELSFPIPEGGRIEHGSFIGPTAHVHEDAIVQNSVIAQHAVVGANSVLKHCVLMNGSTVEDDVHLEHSILSPGAIVSSKVSTSNVILGDNERLENV